MKHFKNIPMADMEIVLVSYACTLSLSLSLADMEIILVSLCHLIFPWNMHNWQPWIGTFCLSQPEKKNPGLTPMDWVKFLVSAIVGLVSVLVAIKSICFTVYLWPNFFPMCFPCLVHRLQSLVQLKCLKVIYGSSLPLYPPWLVIVLRHTSR